MMKRAEFKPNRSLPIPQLLWKKVPGAEAVSAVVAAAAVANHVLFLVKGAMKKGFKIKVKLNACYMPAQHVSWHSIRSLTQI